MVEWILLNQTLASKPASPLSQENWENKLKSGEWADVNVWQ